jgi:hypothetical protein
MDVVMSHCCASGRDARIGLLAGNGDGTFQPEVLAGGLPSTNALFTSDLNKDGRIDLLLRSSGPTAVHPVLNTSAGTATDVCTFTLTRNVWTAASGGDLLYAGITASNPSCAWTVSGAPAWITPNATCGTGNGGVRLAVAGNLLGGIRNATFQIGQLMVTVAQAPAGCEYNFDPGTIR